MEQFFAQFLGWLPIWGAGIVSLALVPALILAQKMTMKRLTKVDNMVCTASALVGGYGLMSVLIQAAGLTS